MAEFDPRRYDLSPSQKALSRLFPERQVVVRSDGQTQSLRFSTAAQVSATAILALVAGWVGFSSYMYINNEAIIAAKQEEVARAEMAYQGLLAQVTVYRDKISQVTDSLEENHAKTIALSEQAANAVSVALPDTASGKNADPKGKYATHMRKTRDGAQEPAVQNEQDYAVATVDMEKGRVSQERAALHQQLQRLEREMLAMAELPVEQQDAPDSQELRRVTVQRDLASNETAELKKQVAALEKRIVDLQSAQLQLVKNFSTVSRGRSQDLEDAISGTGLNLEDLVKQNPSVNQGGPFIPADVGKQSSSASFQKTLASLNDDYAHWNTMQGLAETLPMGQPLRDYRVTSTFGVRADPVNGDRAIHEGLDLSAPYQTPVAATGEGRVSFAGWRGRYGRVVEIDHGNGVKTRYGHLYKILVRKGDLVDRSTKIGLLGNSGRSTGPHVHYEVIVNGQPCDPSIFIKAGINVLKG